MNDNIDISGIVKRLSIKADNPAWSTGAKGGTSGGEASMESASPVDGRRIASVGQASAEAYNQVVAEATVAFVSWRTIPAPRRGELVRQFGAELRKHKQDLGTLVSYEMGKSLQEGLGEVQEMIDICDFAVGLSRQLYGLTMPSERPSHRMYEQWHPLGVVGVISAFNFPVAVWSWNAAIAWVCGNVCVWKPSEKTPVTAAACQHIIAGVLAKNNLPDGISCLVQGGRSVGEWLAGDQRVALVSATGSTGMGKSVAAAVAARLGKSILELGGNNAIIITEHADLDIALPAAVFGAVGTAGQRCTTTRRLIIHEAVYERFKERLIRAYGQLRIGNPLDENSHIGPLIDKGAVTDYEAAIVKCKSEGGRFLVEGGVLKGGEYGSGCYVRPCIAEVSPDMAIVKTETFAPILYIMKYHSWDEAIRIQNDVPQGLSSAIMTLNIREAEQFLSAGGSDCGIANVNIGRAHV